MRKKFFLTTLLLLGALGQAALPSRTHYPSLRSGAERHRLHVGITDAGFGTSAYENTIPAAFNSLTPESVMKFENIHPCPPRWLIEQNAGVAAWVREHGADRPEASHHCTLARAADDEWEWERLDRLLTWANEHQLGFRGHTFLWHMQNPGWLTDGSISLTTDQRRRVLEEHIQTAIAHTCTYPNLYAYDIVNEAIQPDGSLVSNPWSPLADYIDLAFRIARRALETCGRPEIRLYYNDFEFEYGGEKADAIYAYLSHLLLRPDATPIDGIGFQTHSQTLHITTLPHDAGALMATLDRFSNGLGLETAITETDLPIAGEALTLWYGEQGRWLGERLQACLDAANCVGYTLWGTHDGASWRVYFKGDLDPLIFYDSKEKVYDPRRRQCVEPASIRMPGSERFCPKPAYTALADVLRKHTTR
ncbi:MAG: endo-1,4-beta-xylanase [Chloroflexota bacterium]